MIMYVDETENSNFFIVAGVLFESAQVAKFAYRKFKSRVDGLKLKANIKAKVYTEFKSNYIEKKAARVKSIMMDNTAYYACGIVYQIYQKDTGTFCQKEKESIYVEMLSKMVNSLEESVDIIFDGFNIVSFDMTIVNTVKECPNCKSIMPADSQCECGLQYADNVCGAIRLKYTKENGKYYGIISKLILR